MVCNIKRKQKPILLNIKGEGYQIHTQLVVEEAESDGRELRNNVKDSGKSCGSNRYEFWQWPGCSDIKHCQAIGYFVALVSCEAVMFETKMLLVSECGGVAFLQHW